MMVAPAANSSTRLVARHVSELMLERETRWRALVPADRLTTVVLAAISGSTLAHLPYRDGERWIGFEAAGRLGRAINVASVGQSMGLPETSVRRRAVEMVAQGLLVRHEGGYRIASALCEGPRFAELMAADSRALWAFATRLAQAGYPPATRVVARAVDEVPPGVVQRLMLGFVLRVLESFTQIYGDLTTGVIQAGIIAANVHHLTVDPELARRYAGDEAAPPDALRRPITIRALSKALDLPFETVRRRVGALIAAGAVVAQPEGVIVPTRVLQSATHLGNNRRILTHADTLLNGLTALATNPRLVASSA